MTGRQRVETPRSFGGSKNRVDLIEKQAPDGRGSKDSRHKGRTSQWESGRVTTPRALVRPRPTDPTVTVNFDDFEDDYDDYTNTISISSPRPRVTAATTPCSKPQKTITISSTPSILDGPSDDYNPCDIRGTCGPNAKCRPIKDEPTCSCPSGFSGIPRNGRPDPQHGCVRTPQSCSATNSTTCAKEHTCVRDVCLQGCSGDTECALGERCISNHEDSNGQKVCIKICFYDAHCLAGEYCEENVCRPGCRSDSNCPFGQVSFIFP